MLHRNLILDLNDSLTNYTTSRQNSFSPKVGITWQKSKFTVNLNSRTSIVEFDNHSLYLEQCNRFKQKICFAIWRFSDYDISLADQRI